MIGEQIAKNLIEKYNPKSVLFCPYKEEMWDSMQTIYEAFKKTDIRTEIMPIAYYTLYNMSIFNINIEFPEYASNFPMLIKRDKERVPYSLWDIIIFHYPYDNLNTLTRPVLMSGELKAFCNNLVLVHYACRGENQISEEDCLYTGVRNSDLFIVETEEQAKIANKCLLPYGTEAVAWGSAKFDLIERADIPEEWKKKAEGRRVVFYQTSIIPYMRNINKLSQVQNIICKYLENDKVCMIWRPHPLYLQTIISHNRNDLKAYLTLVEMVKNSPKDIFDNTQTPETAIKFADEMLSDRSSLVTMWKTTGKKLTVLEN